MRPSRLMLLLLILLAFWQMSHYEPLLPDRMATHFDGAGAADGWSSRSEFLRTNLVMVAGFGLLFVGITALIHRVPDAHINLPNKEYWLTPERRAATLDWIGRQMEWCGAATLALLLGMTQLTIRANLTGSGTLGGAFWLFFGGYMLYMGVWLVARIRRAYMRVPRQEGA